MFEDKEPKLTECPKELSISYCNGCHCMTKSIRNGRAFYKCGKCGYDKSLGDIFQYQRKKK